MARRPSLGGTPSRPLGETAVLRAVAELAHHDGVRPAREAWQAVHLGGLLQTTYRGDARGFGWPAPWRPTSQKA